MTAPGLGMEISLEKGETIRTEICCKFTRDDIEAAAAAAGLRVDRIFREQNGWYSLARFAREGP